MDMGTENSSHEKFACNRGSSCPENDGERARETHSGFDILLVL